MKNIISDFVTKGNNWSFIFHPYRKRLPKSGVRVFRDIKDIYGKKLHSFLKKENAAKSIENYRFKINIVVYNGSDDKLGAGDLDNYAKGVLDIINNANLIWGDDKQVDELYVKRKYCEDKSRIEIVVNVIKK